MLDEKMMNKIKWLQISYWTAAIADFLIAILVLIPSYVCPIKMVSAVNILRRILLILANRNAIEQRWVFTSTMIVVALIGVVKLHM